MTIPNGPPEEPSLRAWAAELEAAARIARDIAPTAFLPASLRRFYVDDRGRPLDGKEGRQLRVDVDATTATAAAAIMTGQELGLPVMASLRSITIINDTPSLNAITLRAILQHAGHDIWVAESTETKAVVRARRAGSTEVQQSIWTIDRARTAGLYPGSERSQWRRNPTAMLVARASAEAARWIASDAILGVPLIVEELLDALEAPEAPLALDGNAAPPAAIEAPPGNGQAPAPAAVVPAPRQKRARKTPAAPAPLPTGPPAAAVGELEPVAEVAVEPAEVAAANAADVPHEPDPEPGKISREQLARLHAGLRELGLGDDRDAALALLSRWTGREVASSRDLTTGEASAVLDRLSQAEAIGAALEAIGVEASDGLGLVAAWAGRPVEAITDLTVEEGRTVLERLEALRSVARQPEEASPDDS